MREFGHPRRFRGKTCGQQLPTGAVVLIIAPVHNIPLAYGLVIYGFQYSARTRAVRAALGARHVLPQQLPLGAVVPVTMNNNSSAPSLTSALPV